MRAFGEAFAGKNMGRLMAGTGRVGSTLALGALIYGAAKGAGMLSDAMESDEAKQKRIVDEGTKKYRDDATKRMLGNYGISQTGFSEDIRKNLVGRQDKAISSVFTGMRGDDREKFNRTLMGAIKGNGSPQAVLNMVAGSLGDKKLPPIVYLPNKYSFGGKEWTIAIDTKDRANPKIIRVANEDKELSFDPFKPE